MAFAIEGPSSIEVLRGETVKAGIHILATSKPYRNVSLTISGLPSGVSAQFSPMSGKPSFNSILTLLSSSTSATGAFTLTVRARDAKGSKTMPIVFRNTPGPNIPPPPPPSEPPPEFTADVWVAKTGDDTNNDGRSEGAPKLTIGAGLTVLNGLGAGKRMAIKQGTYSETIGQDGVQPISGSSWSVPTTIIAYPSHTVVIDGTASFSPLALTSAGNQYIIFDGLVFDNRTASSGAVYMSFASFIRLIRCEAKNGNSTGGIEIFDAPDVEIIDCLIHDNGNSPDLDHGIYTSSHRTTISGCTIHSNAAHGVQFFTGTTKRDDGKVLKCRIYNNGACGIVISDQQGNSQFINNVIFENGTNVLAGERSGIYAQSNTGIVVYNNTIVGNAAWGYSHASGTDTVRNNIFYNNGSGDITGTPTTETNNWKNADGDPNFFDLPSDDYHLTSSSGPRNNGATIAAVTDDFDDVTRPKGAAYDQGAYEFIE